MKCIRCGHDSKYKDRFNRTCPSCKGRFAFEPKDGDPVTDPLFLNAISAVSGEGRIRWGVEHLYYEVCRRKRGRVWSPVITFGGFALGVVLLLMFLHVALGDKSRRTFPYIPFGFPFGIVLGPGLMIVTGKLLYNQYGPPFVRIDLATFNRLWSRWREAHGTPAGLIERQPQLERKPAQAAQPALASRSVGGVPFGKRDAAPALEPDIGDYSFDRAVICDRARTVDLLVANNFHFENNCAVLSIDGYPPGPFATVKAMLKRNPRILVVTLHDATPDGCRLATRVANDPDWFGGKLRIIDLGLRPRHASPFRGLLLQPPWSNVGPGGGLTVDEAQWLGQHQLELAAVRPEQVLKRLFRGLQAHANDDRSGGGVSNCSAFDGGGGDGSDGHGLFDSGEDSFG